MFPWLVAECPIDEADQFFSGAVAPDIVHDGLRRGICLRYGSDVRRDRHLRVPPERMAVRQRLGIGDIEHRGGEVPAIESLNQGGLV